jgi:ribosomal protein S18 acetylase RimI-like enzyme
VTAPVDASAATVRLADVDDPADLDALAQLRFAWRAGEGGESGDEATFRAAFAGWCREHRDTHRAWLGFAPTGAAVGMAWLAIVQRVPGPERFRRLSGYIQSVYVTPAARGHGVGGSLVDAAVEYARAAGLDYLAVHPSDLSYSLYRRAGFGDTAGVLELGLTRPRRPAAAPADPAVGRG